MPFSGTVGKKKQETFDTGNDSLCQGRDILGLFFMDQVVLSAVSFLHFL